MKISDFYVPLLNFIFENEISEDITLGEFIDKLELEITNEEIQEWKGDK